MPKKPNKLTKIAKQIENLEGVDPKYARLAKRAVAEDLVSLARRSTEAAMRTLTDALEATKATRYGDEPDWRSRIDAARELLNRGFGRAPQIVQHLDRLDDNTLMKAAEAIAAKRGVVIDAAYTTNDQKPSLLANTTNATVENAIPDRPPRGSKQGPPHPTTTTNCKEHPENGSQEEDS